MEHAVVGPDENHLLPADIGRGERVIARAHGRQGAGRRAHDDRTRVLDVAQLGSPALAADEIDQPGVVAVHVHQERREGGHIGGGESQALQGGAAAGFIARVDRPAVGSPAIEQVRRVPEDGSALGHRPARGAARTRGRDRLDGRIGRGLHGDAGHVVGPQMAFQAGVHERSRNQQLLPLAGNDDLGRRRGPRIFLPGHVNIIEADGVENRRLVGGVGVIGHGVRGGGKDGHPAQPGAVGRETEPRLGAGVDDGRAFEFSAKRPGLAVVVGQVIGNVEARLRSAHDPLAQPADAGLGDGVIIGVEGRRQIG